MDIEAILTDKSESIDTQNRPPFESTTDYEAHQEKINSALEEWKALEKTGREKYKGNIKLFYKEKGLSPDDTPDLQNAKNLHLLNNEISARVGNKSNLDLIILDELGFPTPAIELLENAENSEHIRELYKTRKRTTGSERNAGISTDEARRIKTVCDKAENST